ncbi:MAG: hypothetical protein QM704_19890 [Anaeromyxobacteraceae bacterium]
MSRLGCVAIGMLLVGALPSSAGAAEVTRVATAGEKENPFDLVLSVRWDRLSETSTINRETAVAPSAGAPFGRLDTTPQFRYSRTRNAVVPRIAFGIYEGLELHAEAPYVLADDRSYKGAKVNGTPASNLPGSVAQNRVDAMNQPCTTGGGICPIFPEGEVFHGGQLGDVKAGFAWAILDDAKDDTTSSWVVGLDVTFPSAKKYDPAAGRGAETWLSPYIVPAEVGPFGEKIWRYELSTALSRRYGPIDPYVRLHVTATRPSSSTYSNCDAAAVASAATPVAQMTLASVANCASSTWKDEAGARLPWLAGGVFGVELVPYDNPEKLQKVALDLSGSVEYTSDQRFFNPLTDVTGKLMWTQAHYTVGGRAALRLRASRFVTFLGAASYVRETDHFVSGESLGKAGVDAGTNDVTGQTANPLLNPNFDWRYDAPGRRFRVTDSGVFTVTFLASLGF